jgi:transposase-like protein
MTTDITSPAAGAAETKGFLGEDWFDPLEAGVRTRIRAFIEERLEAELEAALGRKRYARRSTPETGSGDDAARSAVSGHRHGHRERSLIGTFGAVTVCVPRARLATPEGGTTEWRNASIPAYQRLTRRAEALIAGAYLSGTNTRRVRRALAALFGGAVGKDVVSRVWRKGKTDWDAWTQRDLSAEPIIRLILDGTVVRVRLDRKATAISLLVVLGVRQDGQKVLLAVKNMGGESEAAWRAILDDLVARGLKAPEFVIVDGAPGLEKALAALWPDVPAQRCTVHKHRNLLSTGTSSPMPRTGCMRRSRRTTPT